MSDAAGNGKYEKAAENALLKLVARYSMVAIVPLLGALGGTGIWLGNKAWESIQTGNAETKAAIQQTGRDLTDLRLAITAITGAQGVLSNRVDAHSDRFKGVDERNAAQDARMDRQDNKIDAMQLRIWALPANVRGGP